jgi:enamine deaminase RidA (YjgF/YER057c/UK114 family)
MTVYDICSIKYSGHYDARDPDTIGPPLIRKSREFSTTDREEQTIEFLADIQRVCNIIFKLTKVVVANDSVVKEPTDTILQPV